METIKLEKLKEKMDNDEVVVLDVLSEEEYNKSHIKGAINLPLERVATEAGKRFEKDQQIVVYCSDSDCTASPTAAKKLEQQGFENVYHFKGGKKEWKEAGYPMAE